MQSEHRHSFGVLHDLFRDTDLDDHRLRGPVREALAAVLLREAVTSPVDAQLVEVGVHDLTGMLARDHQVVVFVDDTQWADSGSLQALTFAARRLDRASVQFLLTRRTGFSRTRPSSPHSHAGTCVRSSHGRSASGRPPGCSGTTWTSP